mgnify:CR=1 FL=1
MATATSTTNGKATSRQNKDTLYLGRIDAVKNYIPPTDGTLKLVGEYEPSQWLEEIVHQLSDLANVRNVEIVEGFQYAVALLPYLTLMEELTLPSEPVPAMEWQVSTSLRMLRSK